MKKSSPSSQLHLRLIFILAVLLTANSTPLPERTRLINTRYVLLHRLHHRSCHSTTSTISTGTPPPLFCFHHKAVHRSPPPPPPLDYDEIDPRYGVEKRLVPSGPNPLHN